LSIKIIQSEPLLNLQTLKKYDIKQMYKIYDRWPEIAKKSYESNLQPLDIQDVSNIVFAGMGGIWSYK